MPAGIVEELFIATDPTTGLKEVWYRNSNVTQSLAIRSLLNANPAKVQWGTWKGQFVVQTGTAANQQYAIFNLIRVGLSSGDDGIGPTATAQLVRTETPLTSTLPIISLSVDHQDEVHWKRGEFSRTDGSGALIALHSNQNVRSGTGTVTRLLPAFLTSFPADFGLDSYGDLIFVIINTPAVGGLSGTETETKTKLQQLFNGIGAGTCGQGAVTTTSKSWVPTVGTRSNEAHLFVVNVTRSLVLFSTAKAFAVPKQRTFWANNNSTDADYVTRGAASTPYDTTLLRTDSPFVFCDG